MADSREVFLRAVEDHLNGTPHARHPVQFRSVYVPADGQVAECTLCGAVVADEDLHRAWHDAHVSVHNSILREAHAYSAPPRYGG